MGDPKAYEQNQQPSIEEQLKRLEAERSELLEGYSMDNSWGKLEIDALDRKIKDLRNFLHYEIDREVAES